MVKIFINGVCGRMGHAIVDICNADPNCEVVAGADLFAEKSEYKFPVFVDPFDCDVDFDCIIDFSNKAAVDRITEFAISKKKAIVVCTTGLSEETIAKVNAAANEIPVFKSANMSYGMNVVFELVRQATKAFYPEIEIEIVEAHHNRKLDAPSGTALAIADVISEETNNELTYVYDRHDRLEARGKKELGISAVRGGNIVGEHEVMFIADEEIVKISHSAQTRTVFARGSVTAAKFIADKAPGYYTMQDIVASAFN